MAAQIYQVCEYAEMKEQYAYVRKDDEITLLRCWGGNSLALPAAIDGRSVTRLADHIFSAQPSRQYAGQKILMARRKALFGEDAQAGAPKPDDIRNDTGQPHRPAGSGLVVTEPVGEAVSLTEGEPAAAERIEQLILPANLREIGSYAFYGCRALKRLVLPQSLEKLGRGIFTACNHLEEIRFTYTSSDPPLFSCLREILGEIEEEILVTCIRTAAGEEVCADWDMDPVSRTDRREGEKDQGFRLLFPGYIEESIENTPARIIEVKFEGMGYQYRQCFRNKEIDFARYDSLFYLASVQENPPTSVRLALNRLWVPTHLASKDAQIYVKFLREHAAVCADQVLDSPWRISLLQMLRGWDYFDRDLLDYWSMRCVQCRDPQAVSLLSQVQREKYPVKKKQYLF